MLLIHLSGLNATVPKLAVHLLPFSCTKLRVFLQWLSQLQKFKLLCLSNEQLSLGELFILWLFWPLKTQIKWNSPAPRKWSPTRKLSPVQIMAQGLKFPLWMKRSGVKSSPVGECSNPENDEGLKLQTEYLPWGVLMYFNSDHKEVKNTCAHIPFPGVKWFV